MRRVQSGERLKIRAADWNTVVDSAEAWRLSGNGGAGSARHAGHWEFGRLDQSVEAGVLSDKTMTVWHGPAWGDDDAATDNVIPVHYATDDMSADTYVIASLKNGKWYVMPWDCPPDEEEPAE